MSLHKLSAGSGYDYLTRQVAVQDATEKGHLGLATYYSERGETPGTWVGRGCNAVAPGFLGSAVSAEQMQLLFGAGQHPLSHERAQALGNSATAAQLRAAYALGAPFQLVADVSRFRVEVARRVEEWNQSQGHARDDRVPTEVRARIRSDVAREFFVRDVGREPFDARELAGAVARHSRSGRSVVAGFDLTFSPPKSVSTLWAVADLRTSARIERAHNEAVAEALRFVEDHLLYSREGARGARQVDVDGLVGAAFTHRDSRAGDPDLHTHVAVANKVRTVDSGKWLAIDARLLYQGAVAASETYNTALVKRLEAQGFRFEDRTVTASKRPVRELVGVPQELNQHWSTRRRHIEQRRGELATNFQHDHGRPPTTVEGYALAQQATLETRDAKHAPRTVQEQRQAWHAEAVALLGSEDALTSMLHAARRPAAAVLPKANQAWFDTAADLVLTTMEHRSATWRRTDVRAEALRQVRLTKTATRGVEEAAERLTKLTLQRCQPLKAPDPGIHEPQPLRRRDGSSVYTVAGAQLYTSQRILDAERTLVQLAGQTGAPTIHPNQLDGSLAATAAERGYALNPGQRALVTDLATSGRRVQLAIAPAGSGKTTAMDAFTAVWRATGATVIGLAPSAAAASQLASSTGVHCDTVALLAWGIEHERLPTWAGDVAEGSLLLVDEAGMADTMSLARVVEWAVDRGAVVRLIGDDQQLAAIGAGGVLRDIQAHHGAASLTQLMRFTDPAEAAASLALRDGDPAALGFYLDHDRIHVGDLSTVVDDAFTAWRADTAAGQDAIMLAPTRELVAELNSRARHERLGGHTPETEALLADGNHASDGDVVLTRRNERSLRTSRTDWVKNGDRWQVRGVASDGALTVQSLRSQRLVTLPAAYVAEAVELGYATTIHAAQGVSADVMHGIATGEQTRQQLYTMLSRGRHANYLWLQTTGDGDPALLIQPAGTSPATPVELLEQILARDEAPRSATTHVHDLHRPETRLADAARRYSDGLAFAAEHLLGCDRSHQLDVDAERIQPGLTGEPAWPTLRSQLILLAAEGANPSQELAEAHARRPIDGSRDMAAVLSWRLPQPRGATSGPLPWLPAAPRTLNQHPVWGPWLAQRAELVMGLAERVRQDVTPHRLWLPASATARQAEELAIWRAAQGVPDTDLRPTGPRLAAGTAGRYQRQLDEQLHHDDPQHAAWLPVLEAIGKRLPHDPSATTLTHRLDELQRAGHDVHGLVAETLAAKPLPDDHPAAALLWRLTNPPERMVDPVECAVEEPDTTLARLELAAMVRRTQPPLPLSDDEVRHQMERADLAAESPVPLERLAEVNRMAQAFYTDHFRRSGAKPYLAERLGTDLSNDPTVGAGHAPAGWTTLVRHLRRHGVTDLEMVTAGLAKPASTGRLIDRFRDRLTLPITNANGDILGFVARANPHLPTDQAGPKYLNTPTTSLFCKGDQFYGVYPAGATPVIVEGPLDALAVTLATEGRFAGLAPLGTSLTTQQARLLENCPEVIIATDADRAGDAAAERDFWALARHRVTTRRAELPAGSDPAQVVAKGGSTALVERLVHAKDLATLLVAQDLTDPAPSHILLRATPVIACAHPHTWQALIAQVAEATHSTHHQVQALVLDHLEDEPNEHTSAPHPGTATHTTTLPCSLVKEDRGSRPAIHWSHREHALPVDTGVTL